MLVVSLSSPKDAERASAGFCLEADLKTSHTSLKHPSKPIVTAGPWIFVSGMKLEVKLTG